MRQLYGYVGPAHILEDIADHPPGTAIHSPGSVRQWLSQHDITLDRDAQCTVTFVISIDGVLMIADRHSEHVACAGQREVLGAGEMTFEVNEEFRVVDISNQSTGYCPEPTCWDAIEAALDRANIPHPGHLTRPFIFRFCEPCQARNLIKDGWFECALCGGELPEAWNFTPQ